MPKPIEWALIADASQARLLEREVPAGAWAEREPREFAPPNPLAHERGSERPGRVHESVGATRHAVEPRQDPHRVAKQEFAQHLADRLEAAARAKAFARLLLVAPPRFLGDLRQALGPETQARLRGDLDKDLVKHTFVEIVDQLAALPRG